MTRDCVTGPFAPGARSITSHARAEFLDPALGHRPEVIDPHGQPGPDEVVGEERYGLESKHRPLLSKVADATAGGAYLRSVISGPRDSFPPRLLPWILAGPPL